jgi:HEAT repeat protein
MHSKFQAGLILATLIAASASAADDAAPDWAKFDDPEALLLTDPLAKQIGELPAVRKTEAIERLQMRLKAEKIEIRRRAALTLDKLGDKSGVPVMIAALGETTGSDRNNVVVALRIMKDERAIPALRAALKDKTAYVRSIAVAALGELKAKEAYGDIVALTTDKPLETGPNNTLNCIRMPPAELACYALGALGDKRAVPVLIKLLDDKDVMSQARQALETLTGQKLGDDPAAWAKWWDEQGR